LKNNVKSSHAGQRWAQVIITKPFKSKLYDSESNRFTANFAANVTTNRVADLPLASWGMRLTQIFA